MSIRRHALASLLSFNVSRRHVLACGVVFALAQVAACSSQISVGHGQADFGGMGGDKVMLDQAAQGGSGNALTSAGNGGGLEVGGQAGAPGESCTGSLDSVNQAVGPACPASLCEANAVAVASCSLSAGVLAASRQSCAGMQSTSFDLGDGMSKTCVYKTKRVSVPNNGLGGPELGAISADGDLIGVSVTDARARFCDDTSNTFSAGQLLPADCTSSPSSFCNRSTSNGEAGASNSGASEEPIQACYDRLSGTCEPCCPATPPDCSDKPNGYPGYRCTEFHGSYCSCSCSRGEWVCGC